jgi:hypothetical protein
MGDDHHAREEAQKILDGLHAFRRWDQHLKRRYVLDPTKPHACGVRRIKEGEEPEIKVMDASLRLFACSVCGRSHQCQADSVLDPCPLQLNDEDFYYCTISGRVCVDDGPTTVDADTFQEDRILNERLFYGDDGSEPDAGREASDIYWRSKRDVDDAQFRANRAHFKGEKDEHRYVEAVRAAERLKRATQRAMVVKSKGKEKETPASPSSQLLVSGPSMATELEHRLLPTIRDRRYWQDLDEEAEAHEARHRNPLLTRLYQLKDVGRLFPVRPATTIPVPTPTPDTLAQWVATPSVGAVCPPSVEWRQKVHDLLRALAPGMEMHVDLLARWQSLVGVLRKQEPKPLAAVVAYVLVRASPQALPLCGTDAVGHAWPLVDSAACCLSLEREGRLQALIVGGLTPTTTTHTPTLDLLRSANSTRTTPGAGDGKRRKTMTPGSTLPLSFTLGGDADTCTGKEVLLQVIELLSLHTDPRWDGYGPWLWTYLHGDQARCWPLEPLATSSSASSFLPDFSLGRKRLAQGRAPNRPLSLSSSEDPRPRSPSTLSMPTTLPD